jgi:hypothetical protein
LAKVGFLDAGGKERLAVGREVPAEFRDFLFALVKRLTHAHPSFAYPAILVPPAFSPIRHSYGRQSPAQRSASVAAV